MVPDVDERPRRFLWRLALVGYDREIAAAEQVSLTTTSKQIARAKRLLRAADAERGSSRPATGDMLARASARTR